MFVKKLVEKASKKPGGNSDGLKSSEVEPRLVFHYGIPSGSTKFAYDPIQKILALSTKDGRIKLFGKDNTQVLLDSKEAVPSKFLTFIENRGFLLNVTLKNNIEVWDIEKKALSHVHVFEKEITSFAIMQCSPYMYAGDSGGNVSILKLEQEPCNVLEMKYTIPLSASHGHSTEIAEDTIVTHVLPQPMAESKRVLIIFKDGRMTLWDIRESKSIFITGGNDTMLSQYQEAKKVTSACWACPFGHKVVVGYSNGEISIWSILSSQNPHVEAATESTTHTALFKLNLGYKSEKIPISFLRWAYADGKASRLYVTGAADMSTNSLQVILLNEHTESRTIKLGLQLPEQCIDMETISSPSDQSKHKQDSLLLLGKSGQVYAYDDCLIEKYLLQSQSRSPFSLPKEVMVKMPFADSSITVAKFITNDSSVLGSSEEDYNLLIKSVPSLLFLETKGKDGNISNTAQFSGFSKVDNLYITGHSNGAINFWDASCPIFIPVFSLHQQGEDDYSLSGRAVTALYFDGNSRLLVSGDHGGMVRIFRFRPEPYAADSGFMSFQGSSKKRNNHIILSVNLVKVDGSILAMNLSSNSRHLAVGSDQGYVSVIDMQGYNIIYQRHIASEICIGIVDLQFDNCWVHGFEKNILAIATKDSSIFALDSDTGTTLNPSIVRPKKPSRALLMQILDGQSTAIRGPNTSDVLDSGKSSLAVDSTQKQLLMLLCSEKAVYLYSLSHAIQGIKKVHCKKKFSSSLCCWASTFNSPTDVGLMLLFNTGKLEIRSIPELSLIRETSIRGLTYPASKPNSLPDISICSSRDGDLIVANGDQEITLVSVLFHKKAFRLLDSISQIYMKDLMPLQEGHVTMPIIHKEKKKGIFSSVMKEITGSKAKPMPEMETEDTRESIEELSTIFSTVNFQCDIENSENKDNLGVDEDETGLDIDDIDLDDPREKPKEQNMLGALNKQKLANKFNALKGKLKQMKVKTEKKSPKEEEQLDIKPNDKSGSVDQIKRKYGFSSSTEASVAKVTESKLQENIVKLQGINLRATDMQDKAKSFSSMANELLRTAEHGRR